MSERFHSVVLVDDSDDDNFIHERYLRRANWSEHVHTCTSADQLFELLAAVDRPPEVVFLDLNMPQMNGFQVLERLAARPELTRGLRVVILTSSLHHDDRRRAEASPLVAAYVEKPLGVELLGRLKREHLS